MSYRYRSTTKLQPLRRRSFYFKLTAALYPDRLQPTSFKLCALPTIANDKMEAPNRNTQLFGIPYFRLTVKKMQATLRHYNQPPQGRRLKAGLFRQLQLYAQHHIQNQEERAIIQRFARGEIQGHDMQQEFMDLHRRRQQPPALPVPLVRLVPLARPAARPAARQIRSIRRPVRSLSPVQPPPIQPPPQPPVQPQNVIVLDSDSDSESDCLSVVQTRECAICAEDRRLNEFPVTRPTTLCDHEIMACIECVRRSIEENIHDHSNIACPTCRQGLSFEDVIAHASNEQFERYVIPTNESYMVTICLFSSSKENGLCQVFHET